MISTCLLLALSIPLYISAQLHDYTWVMGYDGGPASAHIDSAGLSILSFSGERLSISDNQTGEAHFRSNNVSYSDAAGELLFTFNGQGIYGPGHELVPGGTDWFTGEFDSGWYAPQSSIAFQMPGNSKQVALINSEFKFVEIDGTVEGTSDKLYYSLIEQDSSGTLSVVLRKSLLLDEYQDAGKISACRHANGRDWWILIAERSSNRFYRYLLSPEGIALDGIQEIGGTVPTGLGQALFSPDGTKHVRYNGISSSVGDYVTIYDFDRCTGLLSNFRQRNYDKVGTGGGAAISKNSRYLYIIAAVDLYQYDLWAEDIEATRTLVAEYDGNVSFLPTPFYLGQLAPDGKIYISVSNSVRVLHVIHNPDADCPDCRIEQHGIELPTFNAFSIPNQPNYRLGPIDGSPCDTLGIDNIPLARWRYEQDTLQPFQVQFYDLSDYEPSSWLWDFGDGSTSTDTLPQHTFPGYGTYEACLTVSNANGSDTQCKELEFTMPNSTAEEKQEAVAATAFPNPFRERFSLSLRPGWLPVDAWVEVYDAVGRRVRRQPLRAGVNGVELAGQASGVYVWRVVQSGQVLGVGKIVKL